jgi:hypothetical protein
VFLSRLKKFLEPSVIGVLINPFLPAQFSDAILARHSGKNNPDLFLGGILLSRHPADIFGDFLSRILRLAGLLSHLHSFNGYDEPEILSCSICPIFLIGADTGQC